MNSGPNWARRYGQHHRRLCARPGCGAPAAATLRFQPTQREAWLVDLDVDAVRTEGDLCARHAAGLVLPRGWNLHNDLAAERGEATAPRAPARRARGASIARARSRRVVSSAVELPGLSAVTRTEPEPVVTPAPTDAAAETPAAVPPPEPAPLVAKPTPEASVELAETLDAQTPLLRRAFQNVPRHDEDPERTDP